MSITVQSTKNIQGRGWKAVVYGQAKIGKTRLCATAPAPIIISLEKGLLSLREQDVPYIECNTIQEVYEACDYVFGPKGDKFKTVCFDSISDLGEIKLNDQRRATPDGRQYWTITADDVLAFMRRCRDQTAKNIYFVAKEELVEVNNLKIYRPIMPGKNLITQLPYMFDGLFRLHQFYHGGTPYIGLRCKPDFQTLAGDRSGALDELELPNLTQIFDKMAKGKPQ